MANKKRELYIYEATAKENIYGILLRSSPYLTVKRLKEIGPIEVTWLNDNKIKHIVEYHAVNGFVIFFKSISARNYFMLNHSERWSVSNKIL